MGKILILNGSPRASKSNSKRYAAIFSKYCHSITEYFPISKTNHIALSSKMEQFSDVLFVFPLYADGLPVTLLNFLKTLEKNPPERKPVISVLINCGFFEYQQNDTAIQMMELFCKQNGYAFGSVLKIGSGEAILDTPFRRLVSLKIKKLAASIQEKKHQTLKITMPISKKTFVKASTKYWINYGSKNGITKEEMDTMKIEG